MKIFRILIRILADINLLNHRENFANIFGHIGHNQRIAGVVRIHDNFLAGCRHKIFQRLFHRIGADIFQFNNLRDEPLIFRVTNAAGLAERGRLHFFLFADFVEIADLHNRQIIQFQHMLIQFENLIRRQRRFGENRDRLSFDAFIEDEAFFRDLADHFGHVVNIGIVEIQPHARVFRNFDGRRVERLKHHSLRGGILRQIRDGRGFRRRRAVLSVWRFRRGRQPEILFQFRNSRRAVRRQSARLLVRWLGGLLRRRRRCASRQHRAEQAKK